MDSYKNIRFIRYLSR